MTQAVLPALPTLIVVDANVLIAECLRQRGQQRLREMDLELLVTERVESEFRHEVERRLQERLAQGRISPETLQDLRVGALSVYRQNVSAVPTESFAPLEHAARSRIADPDDAPTIALALALNADIWTEDKDFFGCGLPVWRTDVLYAVLDAIPGAQEDEDAP